MSSQCSRHGGNVALLSNEPTPVDHVKTKWRFVQNLKRHVCTLQRTTRGPVDRFVQDLSTGRVQIALTVRSTEYSVSFQRD
jgi:hypothetical protein